VDNPVDTGDGTLNFKRIANAFDLNYFKITNYKDTKINLIEITKYKGPILVEVMTDNMQQIFDAFKDY